MSPEPFRLGSVLDFRKREENLAQEQLVRAKLAVQEAEKHIKNAEQKQHHLLSSLEEKQKLGLLAIEQARFEEHIRYNESKIESLKNILRKKAAIVQRNHAALIKKSNEFTVLDKLREQQDKTWKDYLAKKEADMLDETAILRHDRKSN